MNIVQIVWHDLGRHLGAYGYRDIHSPSIDRLASQGVLFEQMFCASPGCSPSRASILTGCLPHTHGVVELAHVGGVYREGQQTLGHVLQEQGYRTYLCGFQHEFHPQKLKRYADHPDLDGLTRAVLGYDAIIPTENSGIRKVAPPACDLIENELARLDRPFFLSIGTSEVHRSFRVPEIEEVTAADLKAVQLPAYIPDTPGARKDYARFAKLIEYSDAYVGKILDSLDRAGLTDDTLIFFTTDHGAEFNRAKMTLYDPGLSVACVMRAPGKLPAGKRVSQLASNIDIMPTLLEAAGLPVPDFVQGKSLMPALLHDTPVNDHVIAEKAWHVIYDPMRCIRTERYKYIWNKGEPRPIQPSEEHALMTGIELTSALYGHDRPKEELYDLKSDPNETVNLAHSPEYQEIKKDLKQRLLSHMRATGDPLLDQDHPPYPERKKSNSAWERHGDQYQLTLKNPDAYST